MKIILILVEDDAGKLFKMKGSALEPIHPFMEDTELHIALAEQKITELQYLALCTTSDQLETAVRTQNLFVSEGLEYIWQVCEKSEGDLLKLKGFGRKYLYELKGTLAKIHYVDGRVISYGGSRNEEAPLCLGMWQIEQLKPWLPRP